MQRTDAIATLSNGIRLEYTMTEPDLYGPDKDRDLPTLVLIHGYPQTSYAFRYVLEPLSKRNGHEFRVVAPSYRGAGNSSADSLTGFDKFTLAHDIYLLLTENLGIRHFFVVGHDIGSMVATALAFYAGPEIVKALIVMECPQPGTSVYEQSRSDPAMIYGPTFHFAFHQARGLAEALTEGREEVYLQHFYERLSYDPTFLTKAALDHYVTSFRKANKMRCGFELYRAFEQDHVDMKYRLKSDGKLKMPVLSTGGAESGFTERLVGGMRELATDVTAGSIPRASHWVAKENPAGFVEEIVGFLKGRQLI